MPVPFKRADRVSGLIQAELSHLLLRTVKDPRLHAVHLAGVRDRATGSPPERDRRAISPGLKHWRA